MKNVVIIEDDPAMAMINKRLIERLGYQVINSSLHSDEALLFLKSNNVDLILLDIMLDEDRDGIEVANLIRTNSNTPIIFISSKKEAEIEHQISQIQHIQLLCKPLDYNELQIAIGRVFVEM